MEVIVLTALIVVVLLPTPRCFDKEARTSRFVEQVVFPHIASDVVDGVVAAFGVAVE